ncbi:MAG: hypothetical protein IJM27_11650 [Eubacterium sp.]|nr:hypothetical protein [Eubacterium sp.]
MAKVNDPRDPACFINGKIGIGHNPWSKNSFLNASAFSLSSFFGLLNVIIFVPPYPLHASAIRLILMRSVMDRNAFGFIGTILPHIRTPWYENRIVFTIPSISTS